MGLLHSIQIKGREVFAFEYAAEWLQSGRAQTLDPDLQLYPGPQYLGEEKSNFGIFLDSSPDRWGRVLMKRREALLAKQERRKEKTLSETDFLLGVFDGHRMGALRFKETQDGPFLNDNRKMATPPWTSIRELEYASRQLEEETGEDAENLRWINLLIAPGASLGGARPKASVVDDKGHLWIAKFPSAKDSHDIGAWEMVARELAFNSGLNVPEAKAAAYYSPRHTFLSKRFDRTLQGERLHFASAMTLLGYTDGTNHQDGVSYLELASFIVKHGARVNEDLQELWKRIVFNISIRNIDDHLRNHGFLLTAQGWRLAPAYDMNPTETGTGLSLNISETSNALDLQLAHEVAPYFRLNADMAQGIIQKVTQSVSQWNALAQKFGIPASERTIMSKAFRQE